MKRVEKAFGRGIVAAAAMLAMAGAAGLAQAQETLKIGLLASLEDRSRRRARTACAAPTSR